MVIIRALRCLLHIIEVCCSELRVIIRIHGMFHFCKRKKEGGKEEGGKEGGKDGKREGEAEWRRNRGVGGGKEEVTASEK